MRLGVVLALAMAVAAGCKKKVEDDPGAAAAGGASAGGGGPGLELRIAYGSEKKTWLEEQIKAFLATSPKTADRKPIRVVATAMGSGEAVTGILGGQLKPHVFSPASGAYVTVLNDAWMSTGGHTKAIAPAGEPLVLSPIVIAMWKPMAEALGWPGKALGWNDILAVAQNPKGWGAYGRPEWGLFKLGHTHPEHSNSGLLAVLAEAYAGAGKTRGLTAADLAAAPTRSFLAKVEDTIVHYGKSTGFFADKMIERGPSYVSAAALYENLVIESYGKQTELPLVAIYPVEGTFWSDHPYSVLDADWVGPDEKAAAQALLAFLKARPAQERALALGFRPADPAIKIAAPIDAAHGVDPTQPQTLLEVPDAPTLQALLAAWKATKKASDIVLVFDKSGSMAGEPLTEAKKAAKAFLHVLDPRDHVTLLFFDTQVYPPVGPKEVGTSIAELESRIDGVTADGGTALYDAVVAAHDTIKQAVKASPHRIHALVVMTDGKDEDSKLSLANVEQRIVHESGNIRLFTIAYGQKAEATVLKSIAERAGGMHASGDVDAILGIYRDMAALF